jgi:hypothetical protein
LFSDGVEHLLNPHILNSLKYRTIQNDIGTFVVIIVPMIVRGKDGSLVRLNRLDHIDDDEYYVSVAERKGIEMNRMDRGKLQFDDILSKISPNGHAEDGRDGSGRSPQRKNSLGK